MSNYETRGHEAAFPEINHDNPQFNTPTYGLTKREYFAAMALQGFLANYHSGGNGLPLGKEAVTYADELIKALNETKQP